MREDGIDQKMRKKGNMIRQPSEEEREKGNKEVSKFIQKHAQHGVLFNLLFQWLLQQYQLNFYEPKYSLIKN